MRYQRPPSKSDGCGPYVAAISILLFLFLIRIALGVGGFGPQKTIIATVHSKHVDSGESSHYMVSTEAGALEVDNGWLLGVWNADDLYGGIQVGQRYEFTTKGNRVVNFLMQQYPYIIAAKEAPVEP